MVTKVFLICAIVVSAALATSIPRDNSPTLFRLCRHPEEAAAPARALSKAAALEWKKIASTQYINGNYTGGAPNWDFSSRDTVVYDLAGNMAVTKTSSAHSGWSQDSLQSLDSCVYVNGNLAEEIQENFYNYTMVQSMNGYRDTYTDLDNGLIKVSTHYDWNSTKMIWEPTTRDSIIVSAPFPSFMTIDISILVKEVMWGFDTLNGNWKITGDIARVDSECTPTTFVMAGMASIMGGDSLSETRMVMNFISPIKTMNTLSDETILQKDPLSGAYYAVLKVVMTHDQNGFQTSQELFMWDSLTQSLKTFDRSVTTPDVYGNDTLSFSSYFNTTLGTWDTSGLTRYERLYDAFGNNVSTVTSDFDTYSGTWRAQTKDTVVFAQINSSVLHEAAPAVSKEIVMKKTPVSVRFTGPGISGLRLYNMSGRLVVSMSQKPGPFIHLVFAAHNVPLLSGTYVARVKVGDREMSFKVPVLR